MQTNNRAKVIAFEKVNIKINQDDLEEFLTLTKQLNETERLWRDKRDYISHALKAGAEVEPGMHEAFLSKLVVR